MLANPYGLLYLAAAIINFLLLLALLRKKSLVPTVVSFAAVLFLLLLWGIPSFISVSNPEVSTYRLLSQISAMGYMFIPPVFLTFALLFTGRTRALRNLTYIPAAFGPAFFFLFLALTTELINTYDPSALNLYEWGYDALPGPVFPLFLAWFELLFIISFILIFAHYKKLNTGNEKKQTIAFSIAILVPLIGGTITNGILPILGVEVFPTAVPLTSVMSIIIFYAIFKYSLFEINPFTVTEEIVDSAGEIFFVIGGDGLIKFANLKAEAFFKIERAKMIGRKLSLIMGSALTGTVLIGDNFFNVTSSPIKGRAGKQGGRIISLNDITAQTKTSIALQEKVASAKYLVDQSEKTQRALLNVLEDFEQAKSVILRSKAEDESLLSSMGDGMIAINIEGKIFKVNTAAETMFGFKAKNMLNKSYTQLIIAENAKGNLLKPVERTSYKAVESGKTLTEEVYFTRADGSKFPASVTASPIFLEGKPVGVINNYRDITAQKELERAQIEFISLASHQLNTPLSAIKWFSEMLYDGDAGPLSPDQKNFTEKVVYSVNRMIELVNALLDISRIESGRIAIIPQLIDLHELIDSVLADVRPKIDAKKQKIIVSVYESMPKISIDPQLVRQIYSNLLTNASKYTPAGGEITVLVSKRENEIISQITDTGYGIPKADHKRIFSKFFRSENIITKSTEGTGLGLYLVKAIVESSGGSIWFKSEENKGTTFWFTLPLAGTRAKKGSVTLHG